MEGLCAWDISFSFRDGELAALCGKMKYELSSDDHDIIRLDKAGGNTKIEYLVKGAVFFAAAACSTTMSASEARGNRRRAFLGCVEHGAKSTVALITSLGIKLSLVDLMGMELKSLLPDYPNRLELERRHTIPEATKQKKKKMWA